MRYLWIEDFDYNSEGDTDNELEEKLKDFFDLNDDKVINKIDLASAIDFLKIKENLSQIDAVLIDIRFPENIRFPKDNNSELYYNYFTDIVTYDFYKDKINDATGIILYLLLIFKYHIPQRKIAFISANISSDSIVSDYINEMKEIIAKSTFSELSDDDKMGYKTAERNFAKAIGVSSKEKDWDTLIDKDNEVNKNVNIDNLLKTLDSKQLNKSKAGEINNRSNAEIKYNDVKNKFDEIGFTMPTAFEKPKGNQERKKRYYFKWWEKKLYGNTYNAIRSNVQEMCLIIIKYLEENTAVDKVYSSFLNLLTCDQEEKNNYNSTFFKEYLKMIKEMFAIDFLDDEKDNVVSFCKAALKEITGIWGATAVPHVAGNMIEKNTSNRCGRNDGRIFEHEDNCYYACHATLKILRNWSVHQGIKDIDILDVGLVFLLSIRGIFDIDYFPKEYKKCEENILNQYNLDDEVYVYKEKSLKYLSELNNKTMSANDNRGDKHDIYGIISGLGNSKSKINQYVSMDEIYMLLYHILSESHYGKFAEIMEKIKVRTWRDWESRYDKRFERFVRATEII